MMKRNVRVSRVTNRRNIRKLLCGQSLLVTTDVAAVVSW